jgi:hypothetical protein
MDSDDLSHKVTKRLPTWVVALVLLVTGGLTALAMWTTKMRGPGLAWDSAQQAAESVWSDVASQPQAVSPGWGAVQSDPSGAAASQVAAFPTIPSVIAGTAPIHVDRGVCTNCHSVFTRQGQPVPTITSMSVMTHEYRGVCSNCHQFASGLGAGSGSVVAGTAVAPPAAASPPPPAPPAARPLTEAEWQGLEVGPSTQGGVVVNGAEGTAGRMGLARGDLVSSINAIAVRSMTDFDNATQKGGLAQGTIIVLRNGQRLAFELGTGTAAPAPGNSVTPQPIGNAAPGAPFGMAPPGSLGAAPFVQPNAQLPQATL